MTDKKKISILERLLDDRDEQIRELQQKNMELEEMIESYKCIQDDMTELKNIIRETSGMNDEYKKMKKEYKMVRKMYEKEVRGL